MVDMLRADHHVQHIMACAWAPEGSACERPRRVSFMPAVFDACIA